MAQQAETSGDPAQVVTRVQLGRGLTELRTRSGRSLRDLARAVDSSASTLSGWCRADNLPFPAQDATFVAMLEAMGLGPEDAQRWLDAMRRVRDATPRSRTTATAPPYLGLRSYTTDDADRFHGRGELVARAVSLVARLGSHERGAEPTPGIGFVIGPSGAGKSSLLAAGVVPACRQAGQHVELIRLDHHPREHLRTWATTPPPGTGDGDTSAAALLVVDQFEAVLRDGTAALDAAAVALRDATAAGWRVLVGLRSDAYPHLAARRVLAEALERATLLVVPMDDAELARAIVEPARSVGWQVDDDLVELVQADLTPAGGRHHREAGVLPLLSHALHATWTRARGGRLRVSDYLAAGGIAGSVERSAEHVIDGLTDEQVRLARQLLLRMVDVEEQRFVTRRSVTHRELDGLGEPTLRGEVLEALIAARLVTAERDQLTLAHDALLTAWPRLARWVEESRDAVRAHRRLARATQLWLERDRDPGLLADGARLALLRSAADTARGQVTLTNDEVRYLQRSEDREQHQRDREARRVRRLRAAVTLATVATLLAGSLAGVSLTARADAEASRDEARSRQIALTADRLRDNDPALAADLALSAYRTAPTAEARAQVLRSAGPPQVVRYPGGAGSIAMDVAASGELVAVSDAERGVVTLRTGPPEDLVERGEIELGAGVESFALAFAPDGRSLAIGDTDARVTRWDVTDPDRPRQLGGDLDGLDGPAQGVAFHPDGRELATVGAGPGVLRWSLSDGGEEAVALPTLRHDQITWSVAYHPDGDRLAFGDDLGVVHLRDLDVGADPDPGGGGDGGGTDGDGGDGGDGGSVIQVGDRPVTTTAFAPDGRHLSAGLRGTSLQVYRLGGGPAPLELPETTFGSWVNTTTFGPDGTTFVAGSSDGTVRAWDLDRGEVTAELTHTTPVTEVRFTPDGATLATVATDGSLRLWDVASNLQRRAGARIFGVDYTADGSRLAAFSAAGADLWQVDDTTTTVIGNLGVEDGEPTPSGAGALHPDGDRVALGSLTGEVVLLDLDTDARPTDRRTLGDPTALVQNVLFSPDGTTLAAAGDDTTVRLWDLAGTDPAPGLVLDDAGASIFGLAWHPDGDRLLAAGVTGELLVHDPGDGALLHRHRLTGGEVFSLALDPTGDLLAVGLGAGGIQLWDVRDLAEPRPLDRALAELTGQVNRVAFSPDGTLLAAAAGDGSTWLWDVTDPSEPLRLAQLEGHEGPVFAVAFDPAGAAVAAAGADARLQVWPTRTRDAADTICERGGARLDQDQWARFVPDAPYVAGCA